MCRCQSFGKSGVPWPSGKCMVCGDAVDLEGRTIPPAILARDDAPRVLPRDRYQTDPEFHLLVNTLEGQIAAARFTPSELREAVLLACIMHEDRKPRPRL